MIMIGTLLNVGRERVVGKVDNDVVWQVIVLFVVGSNWIVVVHYLHYCFNGFVVQTGRRKDVPISEGNTSSDAQVCWAFVTGCVKMCPNSMPFFAILKLVCLVLTVQPGHWNLASFGHIDKLVHIFLLDMGIVEEKCFSQCSQCEGKETS